MEFRPIGNWLSVRFNRPLTKSPGGLYLGAPIYSQIATVIAAGEAVKNVSTGDVVMMHKHGDAMATQQSLWYYYLAHVYKNPELVKEYEVPPVVVTDDDVFGLWDDKTGLMPTKKNLVLEEFAVPEMVNGVIRIFRYRQNRKPAGRILKVSTLVTSFKINDVVLLDNYGGVYFVDADGKEKVLIASTEILGVLPNADENFDVRVNEPREIHDPKIGFEYSN